MGVSAQEAGWREEVYVADVLCQHSWSGEYDIEYKSRVVYEEYILNLKSLLARNSLMGMEESGSL